MTDQIVAHVYHVNQGISYSLFLLKVVHPLVPQDTGQIQQHLFVVVMLVSPASDPLFRSVLHVSQVITCNPHQMRTHVPPLVQVDISRILKQILAPLVIHLAAPVQEQVALHVLLAVQDSIFSHLRRLVPSLAHLAIGPILQGTCVLPVILLVQLALGLVQQNVPPVRLPTICCLPPIQTRVLQRVLLGIISI